MDIRVNHMGAKKKIPRGENRRKRIFSSLHDCIIKKGYSKTTLADIAKSADMSPSHLLYYFDGKDAILEDYFQKVALQIVERLAASSSSACWDFPRCSRPMPRSTWGALVNWMFS